MQIRVKYIYAIIYLKWLLELQVLLRSEILQKTWAWGLRKKPPNIIDSTPSQYLKLLN